jgi:mannose-6-phosphate isomerase-like protein (cupin superfamily)
MTGRATLVRDADLEPSWDLKRATEPGFLRTLTTWVGGPEGYINSNLTASVQSKRCAVGLMRMPVGNRQPGVHVHSITEIYVILKGEVESFDGLGCKHRAGPLDCLYIPAGVPHGVQTVGKDDLELIWLHDGIEKQGVSMYLEGEGPYPADGEVSLVSFDELRARGRKSRFEGPRQANWVGGPQGYVNHSRGIAAESTRIAVGLTELPPRTTARSHRHSAAEIYIVLAGSGSIESEGEIFKLGPLDAIHFPAGNMHALSNPADEPLLVMWVHEAPQHLA